MLANYKHWKSVWSDRARESDPFVSMARSSYSLNDYLIYGRDVINGLGGLSLADEFLDVGGGGGFFAAYTAPHVKLVWTVDYIKDFAEAARERTKWFGNVNCLAEDICALNQNPKLPRNFNKVLVGSVLQFLESLDRVKQALNSLYHVTADAATIYLSHNPNENLRQDYYESYERLGWEKKRVESARSADARRLWSTPEDVIELAREIGFQDVVISPISQALPQSRHMYDLILKKAPA